MELRQIEYFVTVNKLKSFSLAANKLYVTQPAITMSIKKLEKELNVELFDRGNCGIVLTACGEIFWRHALKILDEMVCMSDEIKNINLSLGKRLIIGIPSVSCSMLYPIIYEQYKRQYPDVDIDIKDLFTPEVIRLVENKELELGIATLPEKIPSDIETISFRKGRMLILVPRSHKYSQMHTIPIKYLANETIAINRKGQTYLEERMQYEFSKHDITPKFCYFDNTQTIIDMVSKGYYISVFGDTTSSTIINNSNIKIKHFEVPIEYEIGLLYNKNKQLSQVSREFIDFFMDISWGCSN